MPRDRNSDGYDRLEERADEWGENLAGKFADRPVRTGFGLFVKFALILVVLSLVGGAIFGLGSWVGAWGNEAKRIVSPDNVREQFTAVINDWEALTAAADNACTATSAAKQDGDPILVEDPAQAYAATYRRIVVDYNRRQANIFEAGKVGPSGYPKEIPRFEEASGPRPEWCKVSSRLAEIGP